MPSLDDVLEWDNLRAAWSQVADNGGAPGADAVSIGRFARHWGANLHTLRELVRTRRYKTGRLRRVAIPKRSGGRRLLQIPNVADRVLQRAVLNVLEPHFEQIFLPCSHGYRPRRGVRTALAELRALRLRGLVWVLNADIDECFASIDHARLQSLLAAHLADARLLALLEQWMGAARRTHGKGLALGMPTSPLLCNLYLHEMDRSLLRGHWPLVRYADDFVVCGGSQAEAEQAQTVVSAALAALALRLEPTKTHIASFDDGSEFLGIRFEGDAYSFLWQDKRFVIEDAAPSWLWGYLPEGYESRPP